MERVREVSFQFSVFSAHYKIGGRSCEGSEIGNWIGLCPAPPTPTPAPYFQPHTLYFLPSFLSRANLPRHSPGEEQARPAFRTEAERLSTRQHTPQPSGSRHLPPWVLCGVACMAPPHLPVTTAILSFPSPLPDKPYLHCLAKSYL